MTRCPPYSEGFAFPLPEGHAVRYDGKRPRKSRANSRRVPNRPKLTSADVAETLRAWMDDCRLNREAIERLIALGFRRLEKERA